MIMTDSMGMNSPPVGIHSPLCGTTSTSASSPSTTQHHQHHQHHQQPHGHLELSHQSSMVVHSPLDTQLSRQHLTLPPTDSRLHREERHLPGLSLHCQAGDTAQVMPPPDELLGVYEDGPVGDDNLQQIAAASAITDASRSL